MNKRITFFGILLVLFSLLFSEKAFAASPSDSTALVELYDACGGKHWTGASHWKTGSPLSTWEGVTLNGSGRVVALHLSGKNLKGELPASLGELSELSSLVLNNNMLSGPVPVSLTKLSKLTLLDLEKNELTGFPSFSGHASPAQIVVRLAGNRLDFGDLLPNHQGVGEPIFKSLTVSSQKPRSEGYTLAVDFGEDIAFPFVPFEGKNNTYQWQKSWEGMTKNIADTDEVCAVNDINGAELGTYRCLIGNPWIPNLTIVSEGYRLIDKSELLLSCDAGQDQTICSGETVLKGGGIPVPNESHWEVVSTPLGGKATFEDSTKATTKVSLSKKGTYVFKWYLHGGLEHPCWDFVTVTWQSPQAEICEHVLACGAQEATLDLTVTNGNNQGNYTYRIFDDQNQQVHILTNIPYGKKKTLTFPYDQQRTYRLLLYEGSGAPLCLQNPYPLTFSEPQITIQTEGNEKTVCAGEKASFTAEAFLTAQGCAGPQGKSFTYKLYKKQGGDLLKVWAATEGSVDTGPLSQGTYLLKAFPAEASFSSCAGQTELAVLPSSLKAQLKTKDPSCQGSADGSAEAFVTGGDKKAQGQAYAYAWFAQDDQNKLDTLSTLSSVSGLQAGAYLLEVRDGGACADPPLTVFFTLQDAAPLGQASLNAQGCGAEAVLSPKGGQGPYLFTFEEKTPDGYKLLAKAQGQEENNQVKAQASLGLPATVRVTVTDARGCSVSSQDTPLTAPAQTSAYALCFRWRTAPESNPSAAEPAFVSLPSIEADRMKQTIAEQQSRCLTGTEAALFELEAGSCLALPIAIGTEPSDQTAFSFERSEDLHTLFYTDRSGNTLASVPPEGVKPLEGNQLSRAFHPEHTRKSAYGYDESGAVLYAQTPNGGRTDFLYNRLGQLRFSQDGVQQANNIASFVQYDALSRPIRSGTVRLDKKFTDPYQNKTYDIAQFEDLKGVLDSDDASFTALSAEQRYPDPSQSTAEVSKTVYGTPQGILYPLGDLPQTHLRNRVSMISKQNGEESLEKNIKTYFSYDVHGNVTWSLTRRHDLPDRYARSEYDLLTGKVHRSVSNEGRADALWQRFAYDEDGRLLSSESSEDGMLFDKDAEYAFYKHGPLKRVVLGADHVQGIDLTSTLQGLVKGINHPLNDPSRDGENNSVGADAFSSLLHYRKDDFKHQHTAFTGKDPYTLLEQNHAKGGLVGGWVTKEGYGTSGTVHDVTWGRTFTYDQAGRLKISNVKLYNEQTKAFSNTEDYKETFAYDRNSNLTALTRNAHGLNGKDRKQDNLSYVYTENTDRLRHVKDAVGAAAWSGDVDDQPGDNYGYDASGRLVKDQAEGIEAIEWTADDKVSKILKKDKTEMLFRYGTGGERIEKTVIPQGKEQEAKSTLYASGAVYERKREPVNDKTYDEVLTVKERSLTEGMLTKEKELERIRYEEGKAPWKITTLSMPKAYASRALGTRTYALKDHLGNVRVTVSDRKLSDTEGDKPANFRAEILSIARYDAFGSQQQDRQYSAKSYRYGYNGMEKDEELKGSGNSYDYGARFYDPRLGRWLSTDPKASAFPAHSPYNFALNNPIVFNDPDGQAPKVGVVMPNGTVQYYTPEELLILSEKRRPSQQEIVKRINQGSPSTNAHVLADNIANGGWCEASPVSAALCVVLDGLGGGRGAAGGGMARGRGKGPRRHKRGAPRPNPQPRGDQFPGYVSTRGIEIPEEDVIEEDFLSGDHISGVEFIEMEELTLEHPHNNTLLQFDVFYVMSTEYELNNMAREGNMSRRDLIRAHDMIARAFRGENYELRGRIRMELLADRLPYSHYQEDPIEFLTKVGEEARCFTMVGRLTFKNGRTAQFTAGRLPVPEGEGESFNFFFLEGRGVNFFSRQDRDTGIRLFQRDVSAVEYTVTEIGGRSHRDNK